MNRVKTIVLGLFIISLLGCTETGRRPRQTEGEPKSLVNIDNKGLALQGYDPIGFFRENRPVKGDPRFQSVYRSATYHFASAQNKSEFDAQPAKYEPQFGGYCGYGVSVNKLAPIDVKYFQVLDGKLILQHNQKAWDLWSKDVPGNLKKANENFPGLIEEVGS
jgi:YHS domain-containing protein